MRENENPSLSVRGDSASSQTVCLVEGTTPGVESLAPLLLSHGFQCRTFPTLDAFLASPEAVAAGCLVVECDSAGRTGQDFHGRLSGAGVTRPVVLVCGGDCVMKAARFLERGTGVFLEKPVEPGQLVAAVRKSLEADEVNGKARRLFNEINVAVEKLSPRERLVLQAIVEGQLNKAIARNLDVSVRTIEGDRAKIVEKFSAETTGQVVGKYAQYSLLADLGYQSEAQSAN